MNNQHAFTLIELLVVVLIIGILAAVALPQYQKAVEKARWSQWFTTANALKREAALTFLEDGEPINSGEDALLAERLADAFSGGEWVGSNEYRTKNFNYNITSSGTDEIYIDTYRLINLDPYETTTNAELHFYRDGRFEIPCCLDAETEKHICQMLISAFGKDVVTDDDCN